MIPLFVKLGGNSGGKGLYFCKKYFEGIHSGHLLYLLSCSFSRIHTHMYFYKESTVEKIINQTIPQQLYSYNNEHKQSHQINFSNMELKLCI